MGESREGDRGLGALRRDVVDCHVRVVVAPSLRSGASPDLDRGQRTPVNACETLLAPMMPARAPVDEFDVPDGADAGAGAAPRAGVGHDELRVQASTRVPEPMTERGVQQRGER
jgi:hypothetical protein